MSLSVPKDLRRELLVSYPGLGSDPTYWRMLQYLLFPTSIEESSGDAIISATQLAMIAGKEKRHTQRNFRAEKEVLVPFGRDVLPDFVYSGWHHYLASPTPHRTARTVLSTGLGAKAEEIRDRIVQGYRTGGPDDRVGFVDGLLVNRQARADRRKACIELVRSLPATGSRDIVDYHLELHPRSFTDKIRQHRDAAFRRLDGEPDSVSKRQTLNQLLYVLEEPMPFMRPVSGSDRAFSMGPSLTTIRKDMRMIMTGGWVEYDLTAAQLAIIAQVWPVPELQAFLAAGNNFWTHILSELKLSDHHKDGIKKATYALAYGASRRGIKKILREKVDVRGVQTSFFKTPLIEALLDAREKRIEDIERDGELTTIFGEKVPVKNHGNARSALAKEAQAVEVALIQPVYDVARKRSDLYVALYQFDGVTVSYQRKATENAAERQLLAAVAAKAAELGIHTALQRRA